MNNSQYYKTGGICFRLTSIFTFEYITTYIHIQILCIYIYIYIVIYSKVKMDVNRKRIPPIL